MPFGFWVLGNPVTIDGVTLPVSRVSNAFRLLGSGERGQIMSATIRHSSVSNAFRLLGSGEQKFSDEIASRIQCGSQMPFGFWVLGNPAIAR